MLSKGILITSPLEINLYKFTFSTGYPVTFSNTFSKVFLKIEFTSIFYFSKIFQKSVITIRLASWRKSADSDIMTNVGVSACALRPISYKRVQSYDKIKTITNNNLEFLEFSQNFQFFKKNITTPSPCS